MNCLLPAVKLPRRSRLFCLLAASLSLLICTAHAATFEVTSTSDGATNGTCDAFGVNDGCTLREAMDASNNTAGTDTITFRASVFNAVQTIQLSNALPEISDALNITGPGANLLTLNGNGISYDIFKLNSGKNATFSGMTLNNGSTAIYNTGGIATLSNCFLSYNIVGLYTENGTTIVTNCTSTGNITGFGNISGTSTVTNCTFNDRGNGIINGGTMIVTNSTFSGNSNGIRNSGTTTIQNTLCVQNIVNIQGSFINGGNNITSGTAEEAGLEVDGDGNAVLKDNGGPVPTMALVNSSGTAINAGSNALLPADTQDVDGDNNTGEPLPTDTRGSGYSRSRGYRVDVGAFEFQFPANESLVVTTTTDEDNGTSDSSLGTGTSLREAITYANSHANGAQPDEITFDSNVFGTTQTITVGGTALPPLTDDVKITGPGANLLTLDGADKPFLILLRVEDGVSLTVSGLTFKSAEFDIYTIGSTSTLNASQCAFVGQAFGIYNSGVAVADNCTFSGHTNGIYSERSLSVTNGTFSGNTVGIFTNSGSAIVTNSTLSGNGTGIRNTTANFTLHNSICAGNNTANVTGALSGASGSNLTTGTATDAGLDPNGLQDNGGPVQTIALVLGSPALDAANSANAPATDARGVSRPQGTPSDIGSYEAVTLTIKNTTVTEGDSGLKDVTLTVTLSDALPFATTADYATGNADRNRATADVDYASKNGTLTFAAGETTKDIIVQVKGDTIYENYERFAVNISNIKSVLILDGEGSVTITDNEAQPTLSITNVTQAENNSGQTAFDFTVSLTAPCGNAVRVQVAMGNAALNAATAGSDFTALAPFTLTFASGETSKTVTIQVNGDTLNEADERFSLRLSNGTVPIAKLEGVGTILNDDAVPSLRINDVAQAEGHVGQTTFTFTVTLSAPSGKPVMVKYTTAPANTTAATANVDYTAVPLTSLTFLPGETSKQITVLVNGDTAVEPDERFGVRLSNAVNAAIADTEGLGLILNDDVATLLLAPSPFADETPSE